MIGSGTPISHNRAPRPKVMFASLTLMLRNNARAFGWFPLLCSMAVGAASQDIRGLEICTAEKQIDRRTGCLQSNVEFLQKELTRHVRDTQEKLTATARELAAAKTETAALKAALAKLESELASLKKPAPADKK